MKLYIPLLQVQNKGCEFNDVRKMNSLATAIGNPMLHQSLSIQTLWETKISKSTFVMQIVPFAASPDSELGCCAHKLTMPWRIV